MQKEVFVVPCPPLRSSRLSVFFGGSLASVQKCRIWSGGFGLVCRFLPLLGLQRFLRGFEGLLEVRVRVILSNDAKKKKYLWYSALLYGPQGPWSLLAAPWPAYKNVETGLVVSDRSAGSCLFLVSNVFFEASRAFWKSVSASSWQMMQKKKLFVVPCPPLRSSGRLVFFGSSLASVQKC